MVMNGYLSVKENIIIKEVKMTANDLLALKLKIETEGFDYCFRSYSDWEEIDDPDFRTLYDNYVNAANQLELWVNTAEVK